MLSKILKIIKILMNIGSGYLIGLMIYFSFIVINNIFTKPYYFFAKEEDYNRDYFLLVFWIATPMSYLLSWLILRKSLKIQAFYKHFLIAVASVCLSLSYVLVIRFFPLCLASGQSFFEKCYTILKEVISIFIEYL